MYVCLLASSLVVFLYSAIQHSVLDATFKLQYLFVLGDLEESGQH
jgi:hypothetical protein